MYARVCVYLYTWIHAHRSEATSRTQFFPLYRVDPGNQTDVIKFGGMRLYLLSHLTKPAIILYKENK